MTVTNTSAQHKTDDPFASLYHYQFVQLTTFRKNGAGMPTPVWFAPDQGKLYVMTIKDTGKIKRIRNNDRVILAPCNGRGKVLGEQMEAHARELPSSEHKHAITVLVRKYRLLYRVFTLVEDLRKMTRTYIEIQPA